MNPRLRRRLCSAAAVCSISVVGLIGGATPVAAAPTDTYGIALRVALSGQAGQPPAVIANANATVAAAYAPPDSSVSAVDVAAALSGAVGITATNGTASASATTSATQNQGTSRIDGLAAAVLGQPTDATVLSGTATCPASGVLTATTTVTGLSVFGQAITATVNGPTVTVSSATTVAGVTNAVITAAVRTRIETVTATTANATALQLTFTLTGDVAGTPISVPLGTVTAGNAACVRPALPAPTEIGLMPRSGPTAGGTTVTVTGTGFVPGATTVTIGGITIPAGDVTVTSPTTLTFATPPHAVGPVTVTTTTAGGTSGPQTYTYLPPPTESGLMPRSGPTAGGTTVTVSGDGFVPGATTVTIGGITIPADQVTVNGPTSLTFHTPAHQAGPVDVSVTTPGGTSRPQQYTYQDESAADAGSGSVGAAGSGPSSGSGGSNLASTGSNAGLPLILGLLVTLCGSLLLFLGRRQSRTSRLLTS